MSVAGFFASLPSDFATALISGFDLSTRIVGRLQRSQIRILDLAGRIFVMPDQGHRMLRTACPLRQLSANGSMVLLDKEGPPPTMRPVLSNPIQQTRPKSTQQHDGHPLPQTESILLPHRLSSIMQ